MKNLGKTDDDENYEIDFFGGFARLNRHRDDGIRDELAQVRLVVEE